MKAVLLIAGLGRETSSLDRIHPQVPVAHRGKPLLGIWFDKLVDAGVSEVLVNTHWLADQVSDFIENHCPSQLSITISHEPVLLGSAGTLAANRDFFDDQPFFIIYGDNLSDVDLANLYSSHLEHDR